MALQSSGAISIGSLRSEYGDDGSSSLSEFYRGGARVVSSVTTTVSTAYSYYTTTYENQTQYQTQTQYETQYTTSYSTYGEYGFDNYSGAQTFWYGNAGRGLWFIIWAGSYKYYISGYFTSYAHSDGWTYSLQSVMYTVPTTSWGGTTVYIGDVYRTRQVATQVATQVAVQVQVPYTVQVAVQNGPYTGYNYSYPEENRNTGVPQTGTLSLSNFYGGHN